MTPLGRWLLDAFLATGLVKSAGEFKRLVKEGGLHVNDRKITPDECGLYAESLSEKGVMLLDGLIDLGAVKSLAEFKDLLRAGSLEMFGKPVTLEECGL